MTEAASFKHKKLPSSALMIGLADIVIIVVVGYLVTLFRFGPDFVFKNIYILLVVAASVFYFTTALFSGVYQTWRGLSLGVALMRYSYTCAITVSLILGALVFSKSAEAISRVWLASSLLSIYFVGILFRILYFYAIKRLRRDGYNVEGVFVAYTVDVNVAKFNDNAIIDTGYKVAMRYQLDANDANDADYTFLIEAVRKTNVSELWLFINIDNAQLIRDLMHALRFEPVNIRLVPDFGDQYLLNAKAHAIGKNFALDLSCNPLVGKDAAIKRLLDVVVSVIVLILVTPVMAVIAIAIKLTSPGPVTFKQQRNGLYGKQFWVYKFRSMTLHDEAGEQVTQAKQGDSRITKVGVFIRKTSLDELPQFFNVLRGDMAVVGPRPHALAHNNFYKEQIESYMWRNKMKPGVTGWAQVNGFRGETNTVEKMAKRIEHDLWYMQNWSLWLDIKIFFKTFIGGFSDKNAY